MRDEAKEAIGKRMKRNVFSGSGLLLVSEGVLLTDDDIQTLEKHGITLSPDDWCEPEEAYDAEGSAQRRLIEDSVAQLGSIFDEIRETRKIPMAELRKEVVPAIQAAIEGGNLLDLFSALQATDDYTYRHNVAVGAISGLIGSWMGFDRQELLQLTTAGLLHDVGKMLIPQDILNKPGKLEPWEYKRMKEHTVLGYELIKATTGTNLKQAAAALQHHERMDGSGYPLGVSGDQISLFGRIVAVADVFHAMTSVRVYRNPSPFYDVLYQMQKDAFGALDPGIARLFVERIMNEMVGRVVLLTDGRRGNVRLIHRHDPIRPLVQSEDRFIDLSREMTVGIQQIL